MEKTRHCDQEILIKVIGEGKGMVVAYDPLMPVKIGDKILYNKMSGKELIVGKTSFLLIHQSDILGSANDY